MYYSKLMTTKKNVLKTTSDLTLKQRKFVDILVAKWGNISKVDACLEAGYKSKTEGKKPYEIASKLTNPSLSPHVCRYLEKQLEKERDKFKKDDLRSFKSFEKIRDLAIEKKQLGVAVNAEYRMGQMSGFYVDKKEISHIGLEGMSREKLEQRLKELENKINDNQKIIDITPTVTFEKS